MGKRSDEERHQVLIRAKMWDGARHSDVCVRNISSLGMMLQTATPPTIGSSVEISGGGVCAVGRVAWASKHKFGIRTRDRNDLRALIGQAAAAVARAYRKSEVAEPASAFLSSRLFARALDFALIASLGVALASLASAGSYRLLSAPLDAVQQFLG